MKKKTSSKTGQKSQTTPKEASQTAGKGNKKDFIVVGLGGSAGGIRALRDFFATMPPNSGMAFVVILHLSPEHESNLAEIIQAQTRMPVIQVRETHRVEPDNVYVIPPNRQLEMVDGVIRCTELEGNHGERVAIDVFFRTLAAEYEKNAVGIVLSGTGTDGTQGLKVIKEANGFAIVQAPEDAEHDSMPLSAIQTQLVDWVLPVREMPERLLKFRDSSERLHLTDDDGDGKVAKEINADESLREILTVLRIHTGHDFSNYKTPTLVRRIARHLQIHDLEDIPAYLNFLREKPEEIQSLLKNLLINVTNFFRDKDAWQALESEVVPNLFASRKSNDTVRVWSCGCASGEEAYSLAIILAEYAERLHDPPKIQVFATDVDEDAIAEARENRYSQSIEADVSVDRLKRFFIKEGKYYRVKKELREMVLFAPHNVLRNPPFSKLDLISCRNLLIYLNRDTQERVMEIFHFALAPHGFLLLGSSETAEAVPQLFTAIDKKLRIYTRRPATIAQPTVAPKMPVVGRWEVKLPQIGTGKKTAHPFSLGEVHYKLLESLAPPSILVNQDFEIQYLSESASRYLRFRGGEPSRNLLKLVHQDLLPDLRGALFTAQREKKTAEFPNVRAVIESEETSVTIIVRAVEIDNESSDYLLVLFDEDNRLVLPPETKNEKIVRRAEKDDAMKSVVLRLEEELSRTKENLRSTIEQHEVSVEELKASNEELQAINEELRSTTEELETSKEELQSVNEELTTVNHELKEKMDETSRTNSDLQNLMASTDLATIFLDRHLRIKRFTPPVEQIFNITSLDVSRPLEHFTHRLDYKNLVEDAAWVLKKLTPIEREVSDHQNTTYLARFVPYRTLDDRIEGVVLNFIDITERKRTEEALRSSEEKYHTLFDSMDEGFLIHEMIRDELDQTIDMRLLEVNPAFTRHTGLGSDTVGKLASEFLPNLERFWIDTYDRVARTGIPERVENYNRATDRWYSVHVSRVGGQDRRVAVVFEDITERRRREANLAFLAEISENLVHLTNIDETMNALGTKIGEYFKVARVIFSEISEDQQTGQITHEWHKADLPDLKGIYETKDYFSPEFELRHRAGEIAVVRDTAIDGRVDGEGYAGLGIGSFVGVPLIRQDKWRFYLSLLGSEPHDWRDDEIELLRELATRIWTRLDRARAEEALRESEARFRTLSESVPALIWVNNAEGCQSVNREYLEFLGVDESQVLGFGWKKFVHPEDLDEYLAAYENAVKDYAMFEAQFRFRRHDGVYRWMKSTALPRLSPSGDFLGYIGSTTDITDIKLAQEKLRESEERIRIAVDAAGSATWDWDLINDRVIWNDQHFLVLGMEPGENPRRSKDFFDRVHPKDRRHVEQALTAALEKGVDYRAEFRVINLRGETLWMSGYGRVMERSADGKAIRMAGVMYDITERKRAEDALRESQQQLALMMESVSDYAIIFTDSQGIVTSWNTGAEKIFGWTEKEMLGESADRIFVPEDIERREPEKERRTALRRGRAEDERWHRRKDGGKFYVSGVVTPLKNGESEGFVKICRDQTQKIKAETAQRDKDMLAQLVTTQEDERRRIARDIHDHVGQQLTALRLKIAEVRKLCDDREICDQIDEVGEITERLDKEVDFLAWELRPASLDDLGLRVSLENFVSEWSDFTGIKTEFHASGLKRARLAFEIETNLYRIAQEALNNISKHSKASQVSVLLEKHNDTVSLIIEDDGTGFNPKDKMNRTKGMGLIGMSERAKISGGNLEIESKKGKGTTVFARVPAKKA